MSQATFTQQLYAAMSADQSDGSVWSLVDGRIYQASPPPNGALPNVSFHVTDRKASPYFTVSDDVTTEFTIIVTDDHTAGATNITQIHDAINTLLHKQTIGSNSTGQTTLWQTAGGEVERKHDAVRIASMWTARTNQR